MRVIQDKCESLLVSEGELVCMLEATISTGLCCQNQTLKIIIAKKNFQTIRHEARVSKILMLRH